MPRRRASPAEAAPARPNAASYGIADLAREFDVTTRTIRFYEAEGLIAPTRRGQRRIFGPRDRVRLKLILRGKRLGFSLGEIKELLDLYQVDRTGAHQLRELLRRCRLHIAELERRRRDLDAQIGEFKEVETQVTTELKQRGVDPEGDD